MHCDHHQQRWGLFAEVPRHHDEFVSESLVSTILVFVKALHEVVDCRNNVFPCHWYFINDEQRSTPEQLAALTELADFRPSTCEWLLITVLL